jgi:hypothetical protein
MLEYLLKYLKETKLRNVALILKDLKEYKDVRETFREAIIGYKKAFRKEHLHTLIIINNLALIYKNKKQ